MLESDLRTGLTFDDVLLLPAESNILPSHVKTNTKITNKIEIKIPLISSAMDTVTESRMAIALAQLGGIGIIHRNLTIEEQKNEVDKVKRSESGMIGDPITISPEQKISDALDIMSKYRISGVPVINNSGKLVGILTNRDLRFETRTDLLVSDLMTSENLVTVPVGTNLDEAKEILHKHKIEKLLVVDKAFKLRGLITVKDIQKKIEYPKATKDHLGRLRVGAAVGVGDSALERAQELISAHVDFLAIDSAHGHSKGVLDTAKLIKKKFPEIDLIVGNVATKEGAKAMLKVGADAVKVGIGPGSICTTRIVAGVGVPQLTAIADCYEVCLDAGIPVIADGGIKYSGDVVKAIAAGASAVMIGGLLAGTDESPGETIIFQGRTFKSYRGMGSLEAMKKGARDRYFSEEGVDDRALIPEGIEGRVPYKGNVSALVLQLIGGLRSGMGYCGCSSLDELKKNTRFIRITKAGLRESHPHDVTITREAPNYRLN